MKNGDSINLILSGAFVNAELVAEVGSLPPSFLPLGVGRLYDAQIDAFRKVAPVATPTYITLPESFDVPYHDSRWLKEKDVAILKVPDGLSLGESLIYAISVLNAYQGSIRILHGDTLLGNIPLGLDVVAGHEEGDDYSWASITHDNNQIQNIETIEVTDEKNLTSPVACGYFAFSDGAEIARAVIQARYNFVQALNIYNQRHPLTLIFAEHWYDFGHLQTYFRSRRIVTTARAFNSLRITRNTVQKCSTDEFKMNAEAGWFRTMPATAQPYMARLLDVGDLEGRRSYTTEYQYAPNLSELYVFGLIGRATWKKILKSSVEFLEICANVSNSRSRDEYSKQLLGKKTLERLETFASQANFDIEHELRYQGRPMPSLKAMATELEATYSLPNASAKATVMHGDFCFSNILYNSRNDRISVIDPRGYVFSGKEEIFGDPRYDIAKYSHSVDGLYDFILAGRYNLTRDGKYNFELDFGRSAHRDWLQASFAEIAVSSISARRADIKAITISLFISMLPLHADRPDRQMAFIANALRLYSTLKEK